MDDAVHRAACTLDRLLERVHSASDVFFEGVRYEDVIFLGIAVIGTCAGEVVDPIVCVITAGARPISARSAHRCLSRRRCAGRWSLLSKEFRRAGYESRHRSDL